MSFDVYDPCPCGSGKKLKFCCHALSHEMEKVVALQKNNQHLQALSLLEGLKKKHPQNPWVLTCSAISLLETDQPPSAIEVLEQLLAEHPEHQFGTALYAITLVNVHGFDSCKPAVHRAFQRCRAEHASFVFALAITISDQMAASGRAMAARQHSALAMLYSPDDERENIFNRLLEFEGDNEVPYPLRGVHSLGTYEGSDESQKEVRKAMMLSDLGCWGPAARVFARVAEQEPENAVLWRNAGLCRAWDGDELGAAEALHKSAGLDDDWATAVESETLAQLLDLETSGELIDQVSVSFRVRSVSRLISLLDEHERVARVDVPPEILEGNVSKPAAVFRLLDRPKPDDEATLSLDTLPHLTGTVIVFDSGQDDQVLAGVRLIATRDGKFESCQELLQDAAGGELETDSDSDEEVIDQIPADFEPFDTNYYIPPGSRARDHRRFEQQKWERTINETWPASPLSALDGKTPAEASTAPEKKTALAASVFVLDSYCDRNNYALDVNAVLDRLNLEPLPPLDVTDDTAVQRLSVMELHRLPLDKLNQEQLEGTLHRAFLLNHREFLYQTLTEAVSRDDEFEVITAERMYSALAELCRDRFEIDQAFHWIEKGRQEAEQSDKAFEHALQWEMKELMHRTDDPEDPKLNPLLNRLWNYYGTKLPRLRDRLEEVVSVFGLDAPWQSEITTTAAGTAPAGGVWTPDAEQGATEAKKIWLPGQQ